MINANFNIEEEYKKYQGILKDAKEGEVVTRFPPEPSGYLHIGHVKAALLNYHYSQMYKGKMLVRMDDTNPSKEKEEYENSIIEDLQSLGVKWTGNISHTSDYFDYFITKAEELIKKGLAYCDDTPQEKMRDERFKKIESKCRNNSIEENLRIFKIMKDGNAVKEQETDKKEEKKQNDKNKKEQKPQQQQQQQQPKNDKKKQDKKQGKDQDKKQEEQKTNPQKKTDKDQGEAQDAQEKAPEQQEDTTNYDNYCLRAKINMNNLNGCMRDPVLYRINLTPHHRTGDKYRIYPTYDFACPLIDSLEGVTHAMRTNEYSDRIEQYAWIQKQCEVRPVQIWEFSRLNFVNTTLSKRKLTWFVEQNLVDGWDDPRFPTVRGILKRGMRIETLIEFMLSQGPSKNDNLMEWDKIWAINKSYIDKISPRFSAIPKDKLCNVTIVNGPELQSVNVAVHPQNPAMGQRILFKSKQLYIDVEDASSFQLGETVTLMKWGNLKVLSIDKKDTGLELTGEYLPDDKDFKKTKKINWLSRDQPLCNLTLIEYNHLITVDKVEEDMKFEDIVNPNSKFLTPAIGEAAMRNLVVDDIIQIERRGYFRVEKLTLDQNQDRHLILIYIPDGKQKSMSGLSQKVDAKAFTQGSGQDTEQKKKKDEKKAKGKGKEQKGEEQKKEEAADSAIPQANQDQQQKKEKKQKEKGKKKEGGDQQAQQQQPIQQEQINKTENKQPENDQK